MLFHKISWQVYGFPARQSCNSFIVKLLRIKQHCLGKLLLLPQKANTIFGNSKLRILKKKAHELSLRVVREGYRGSSRIYNSKCGPNLAIYPLAHVHT
ncbi:unnamed protein product [Allacma fusca]|uniref:Uncharacterized protein n=1 Tax=Allacma fusca TaxID=39272 RepID=A0A8J2PIZ3_9HEXA|nr:unnamed protein product [Allacma fusca]